MREDRQVQSPYVELVGTTVLSADADARTIEVGYEAGHGFTHRIGTIAPLLNANAVQEEAVRSAQRRSGEGLGSVARNAVEITTRPRTSTLIQTKISSGQATTVEVTSVSAASPQRAEPIPGWR